ncbi:MAG: AAA family ATPase [Firmicutes bacterium]|nr:AAA family ATPase [Bacillota bacterium]
MFRGKPHSITPTHQSVTKEKPPAKPRINPVVIEHTPAEESINDVIAELDSLIGLDSVKALIKEIQAFVQIQQKRSLYNLVSEPVVLHMIFKGNPGTGKTTVARIIGKMFKHMGVLTKGHLLEVERADLVAEYIGQTAQKTRANIKKAMGGILFVDEAYSLARGGEKDFGKEAIDTLVKAMEDHRSDIIVILAGYSQPMEDFLQTNPGLKSRFPIIIDFPNYSTFELFKIAENMLEQRQYKLNKEAKAKLYILIEKLVAVNEENFGNARVVRNIIEKAVRRQAVRLVSKGQITRNDLIEIVADDILEVLNE